MTVLIVDDESYMIEYIKTLIDWPTYGFDHILTARGGGLAKDLIAKYQPELLLTDIRMPKTTGLDLSQMIDEEHYHTKVIIISGYSDFEYAKQALRFQVSEYLVKPVLKEDLVEALERLLKRNFEHTDSDAERAQNVPGNKYAIVSNVKTYINEHYSQELSLELLGDRVNLHPVYLSRIFKEITDQNLSKYICDVRMKKAAELLSQTNLPVHEIMARLGYRKRQHFTKIFKEKYGITPKEYRLINTFSSNSLE